MSRPPPPELRRDFPPGMGRPALQALRAAGFTALEQLSGAAEREVAALHGMGPKGIRLLREALAARGLAFREPRVESPVPRSSHG